MHPLDALGNPVRRAILVELRKRPRSVIELSSRFPVSRPAISRHLRVLEQTGLVQSTAKGTSNVYSVRMQGFMTVRDFIDQFWVTALARLEAMSRE